MGTMSSTPPTTWLARCDNIGDLIISLPLFEQLRQTTTIKIIVNEYLIELAQLIFGAQEVISVTEFCDQTTFDKNDSFIPLNANKEIIKHVKKHFSGTKLGYLYRPRDWLYANKFSTLIRRGSKAHESELMMLFAARLVPDVLTNTSTHHLNRSYLKCISTKHSPDTIRSKYEVYNKIQKIIFHPGSNANGREWPISHWIEAIRILSPFNLEIHLTGRGHEGKQIIANEQLNGKYINFIDAHASVAHFIDHISEVDLLVSCGTGPAHLAAALGTPVITLFPPIAKIGVTRWRPIGESVLTLTAPTTDAEFCANSNKCSNTNCVLTSETLALKRWRFDFLL
jgi:ADP-heptose:LPS heptosyltransferase